MSLFCYYFTCMIRTVVILFLLGSFACSSQTENVFYYANSESILDSMLQNRDVDESLVDVATKFMNYPYKSKSLEFKGVEKLVVDYSGFDCVTLVETSISLYKSKGDFNAYLTCLSDLRYRNGIIDGYLSRLHYFTEWIDNALKTNHVEDVTANLGGIPYHPRVYYMSKFSAKYSGLVRATQIDSLKNIEAGINKLKFNYIPKEHLSPEGTGIIDGDIIAITTSIKGLDITHVGFAKTVNGNVEFLHASSDSGKVVITNTTLSEYLMSHNHMLGIIVLRLI